MHRLLLVLVLVGVVSAASFWHITDIHYDPLYQVGAPSLCKKPDYIMCCENASIPEPNAPPAGQFGSYACDTPLSLVQSTLNFLNSSMGENISFVLWTGDDTPHNIFGQKLESNLENIRTTSQWILETFPKTIVVPLLGNHDYWPVSRWEMPPHCDWLLSNVSLWWSQWLPPDAMSTFMIGGYYSLVVQPGLRVIALNTNFYDAWDPYAHLLSDRDDPGDQLSWLNMTLYNSTLYGEKVYIAGHVAPGIRSSTGHKDVVETFNVRYIELIQQYYPIIAGQFFSHWHRDEFKCFRAVNGTPISVAWLGSSITPYHNVNPSVRKYFFDDESSEILDYEVYFMNLTKANEIGEITWEFEYSPLKSYANMTDMSPATWMHIAETYLNNASLFQTFYNYHTVGCPLEPCTTRDCMRKLYCSTVHDSENLLKSPNRALQIEVDELKYQECYRF